MSEKKKKIFLSNKEFNSPKRPIILKSDREVPKEQPKEKEKQPTFILKQREQSTPREDRPLSPRASASEPETHQPSKIAHNENKEKKILETRPVAPIKQMIQPVKLIDENLEFNNTALEFLNDASTTYLVVSIVGYQSVGKSTILNLIALNGPIKDICQKILDSHEIDDEEKSNDGTKTTEGQKDNLNVDKLHSNENIFKFQVQDIEHIERGIHCTKGIDMYVTEDRVILLDCQALWSPSLIDEVSNTNPITSRSANVVTVDCLQMVSFLMAVSHVMIAVQDWFADYNFLRYIQAAEMLLPSLSTSSSAAVQDGLESTSGGENHPHLLLLHNRCQLEDYTVESVNTMQEFYKKVFNKSNLQLDSGMYMYSDSNKNGIHVDSVCNCYSVEACGAPINMYLLPEIYDDYDNNAIYRGHPPFEELAKRLRWMILGVNKHQITNVPNLSEKGWFHYCNKAWDTIRKCTFFMEYERFLP